MKLIAIGDNVMDYYKDRGEIFPGGNALNAAVLGKRYQADVSSCIGIIGNDQAADHVRQTLASGKARGGMYSVSEGLYYGVPFVVLPQGADQPVIAGQVAKLGAGIVLDMQTLSASELREAAEQVLQQPSFRKAAATVSESFQRAGGYRQAVDEILA